jgi:hypothetical protein
MSRQRGAGEGLLDILFVTAIFNWMEKQFGFGRGCSCSGCGCGCLMLIIFIWIMFGLITGTSWTSLPGQ